jgi:hypothetical protein
MRVTYKYQVMPDLSPEDYTELKADIAKRGVQVAVEYDEEGNVLDGHHRLKICNELGITDWPKVVRVGMTEAQKREHARKLNMARRQLNREQRQELIRQQLQETPEKSDRQIAAGLGVDHKTVGSQRDELLSRGEIPHIEKVVDTLGREQPRQVQRQISPFPTTEEILNTPLISLIPKDEPAKKPVTIYNPTEPEIHAVKQFVATAPPEIVQAVADGKSDIWDATYANQKAQKPIVEKDYLSEHETIRNNTDKAFFTICDRVLFLRDDYSNIAQCLLENPNRNKENIVENINECIERLQLLKAAVLKTTSLRAVK